MALGQKGVNKLDEACRQHDLVYTDSEDLRLRMEADEKLEMQAWERVKAKDSRYKEKIAAWMVMNVMKVKRKWFNRNLRTETSKKRKFRTHLKTRLVMGGEGVYCISVGQRENQIRFFFFFKPI